MLAGFAEKWCFEQRANQDQADDAIDPDECDVEGMAAVEGLAQDALLDALRGGECQQQQHAEGRQTGFEPVANKDLPARPADAQQQQRRDEDAHQRIATCADGLHKLLGDAFALSHRRILPQVEHWRMVSHPL